MHPITHWLTHRVISRQRSFAGRLALVLIAGLWLLPGAHASNAAPLQKFDLPADLAEKSLEHFSDQSGRGLIVSTEILQGVRTNEVKGDFTAHEALDRMLFGTGLAAAEDESTGAFAISRKTPVPTPPKPTEADGTNPVDEPLKMSAFEVRTTQGHGYVSLSSAATKTNQPLLSIPQAVTTVTRDLIDDIGYANSTDVLQFVGVTDFLQGEVYGMRGNGLIADPLLDEMPDATPYEDNVNIDSYTVLKGPAATLYLGAALSGTVLKTSKFPLANPQYSINASTDQWGLYRAEIDFTGPLGEIGDAKFGYRITGSEQGGNDYFRNRLDDRQTLHPTLQMTYHDTVIDFAYDYEQLHHAPNGNSILTPGGHLYTGAGRDEAYFAPGTMEHFLRKGYRAHIVQKLSDNWELKLGATDWSLLRHGSIIFPAGGVDWTKGTATFTARRNYQQLKWAVAQADLNGKYTIGFMSAQTTAGVSYDEEQVLSEFWSSASFGSVTVPLNNPQMDLMVAPSEQSYLANPPANPGDLSRTYRGNAYLQQVLDVIPRRLSLVGGITFSKIAINDDPDVATNPPANVTFGRAWLHRWGVVLNLTKDSVLYALNSTTFSPVNERDITLRTLPNQMGTANEVGIKTAFLDGKITSTIAGFQDITSNQAVFAGITPGGISYFAPIGKTYQEGGDIDLEITLLRGLQVIFTFFDGKMFDTNGNPVAYSYRQSLSFFGRYDFAQEGLHGLAIGAGVSRTSGTLLPDYGFNTGKVDPYGLVSMAPGVLVNMFVTYRVNHNWDVRVNVDNVLDEAYAIGAQIPWLADPSPPRTFSISIGYKFH